MRMRGLAVAALLAGAALAAERVTFENRPAFLLTNGKLELTVMETGGAFAHLVRLDDAGKLSPLWNPARAAREEASASKFGPSLGHFVCVDGFGAPSPEERAAGLPGHGEAHVRPWQVRSANNRNGTITLTLSTDLPLAQETFTRTIRMAEGESVVQVHSTLQSRLAFDRPISWTEHATIGAPFLEAGLTAVDLPARRSMTRPATTAGANRRLVPGREFKWPMAPSAAGGQADLRIAPNAAGTTDIVTVLLDSAREHAFVTAVHPTRRLVFGYLFTAADYPWLQIWDNFSTSRAMARGLEFGTQPFGQSRRLTVDLHSLLGAPAYRWLPAMSRIQTRFLMFYAATPDGFGKVDDVRLEGGKLILTERESGQQVALAATLGL